jgi:enamine deaminase RidA (YjgF/YER057c/UK114 family)
MMFNEIRVKRNSAGRQVAITGAPWEPVIGYSRALRAGSSISVTATIGLGSDGRCPEGAAEQMRNALGIIVRAIEALGGRREDIVRTRIYVTDINLWEEVGKVHGELLGDLLPATTMIEVSRFVDPAAVLEVEADALVGDELQKPGRIPGTEKC